MLTLVLLALLASTGQEPAPRAEAAEPRTASAPAQARPGYTYNAEGRRDPFVSLVRRKAAPKAETTRAPGVPGLSIDEVVVKGIIRDRTDFRAVIQGTDAKTYIVRDGDPLFDGLVKTVAKDRVIFLQDVDAPTARVKYREIEKRVRALDPDAPGRTR